MFGRLGVTELLVILAIALVIFGPSKLPELGKSLGRAFNEFKKGTKELQDELKDEDKKEGNDEK